MGLKDCTTERFNELIDDAAYKAGGKREVKKKHIVYKTTDPECCVDGYGNMCFKGHALKTVVCSEIVEYMEEL